MENLFAIEVIGENLCKYLGCKSILNVKEVSTALYQAMEKQKLAWIRTVQNRFTVRTGKVELPESWKQVVYKLPTEKLKKLGLTLDQNTRITYFGIPTFENDLTLLHFVAGFGDLQLYRFLSSNGNSINKSDPDCYTPLHAAALNGQLEVVQFILDRVQDKNPAARFGTTPLHSAAVGGHEEVFKTIFNEIEDKNPANNSGWTPLHLAASFGHLELCQFILDQVQDKNPATNVGTTPLHLAAQHGHEEIFKVICKEIKDQNTHGQSWLEHSELGWEFQTVSCEKKFAHAHVRAHSHMSDVCAKNIFVSACDVRACSTFKHAKNTKTVFFACF